MSLNHCFEPSCRNEAEYVCQCLSPETYSCEAHCMQHLKSSNRGHNLESIYLEPNTSTREAILTFLMNEKSNYDQKYKKIFSSFSRDFSSSKNKLEDLLCKINSDSQVIDNQIAKICSTQRISKREQDPVLKLLILSPQEAVEKAKNIIPNNLDSYDASNICSLSEEVERMIESLIEKKFETLIEKRFERIEEAVEKQSKALDLSIKSIDEQIGYLNNSFAKLLRDCEENKKEFEEYKQKIENKRKEDIAFLFSQMKITAGNVSNLTQIKADAIQITEESITSKINELNSKICSLIENSLNSEIEADFRNFCSQFNVEFRDALGSNEELRNVYQTYVNTYRQKTSIYLISEENEQTKRIVYDTEIEKEESNFINIPLDQGTCIAWLPNNELFCYGKENPISGTTLIIDGELNIRILPSGTDCTNSSAIFFNENIYCFGGIVKDGKFLKLSKTFDLNQKKWNNLKALPIADGYCHSIIFNKNILISGYENTNILRYSTHEKSFTQVDYVFSAKKRKILYNVGERAYLIECGLGGIYESEINNDSTWKLITNSTIQNNNPMQIYCSYNKGFIHIGTSCEERYYRFKLDEFVMTRVENLISEFNS